MSGRSSRPHLPFQATIEAYGNGGFRFADMSHRGSLLCLPSGIWAWPVTAPAEIDAAALAPVLAEATDIEFLLLGSGDSIWPVPQSLRLLLKESRIGLEVMTTGAAVHTWNIVVAERRRAAAALIAVAHAGRRG